MLMKIVQVLPVCLRRADFPPFPFLSGYTSNSAFISSFSVSFIFKNLLKETAPEKTPRFQRQFIFLPSDNYQFYLF